MESSQSTHSGKGIWPPDSSDQSQIPLHGDRTNRNVCMLLRQSWSETLRHQAGVGAPGVAVARGLGDSN